MSAHTLSEILAIPGNRAVYERLQGLLKEGSAIAFVGAGALAPLYPLWGQLIKLLAHEPVARGLADEAAEKYWLRNAESKSLQVASQIRSKLGDRLYHTFLFETFKDRTGADGLNYTPAHAALMRANFKAYLTTNYDPSLVEARRRLCPEIRYTGFTVWNQNFPVNRWASGDLFKDGAERPVLFAHGHFADPTGIVLDHGGYRQAYHSTPYRRLFEGLWYPQHLVFAGFSFNDVVLTQSPTRCCGRRRGRAEASRGTSPLSGCRLRSSTRRRCERATSSPMALRRCSIRWSAQTILRCMWCSIRWRPHRL